MTALSDLTVLSLDCQTTGAAPDKGRVIEIAWIAGSAGQPGAPDAAAVRSYLIGLPPQTPIPKAVQKVTGITDDIMGDALDEDAVWHQLLQTAAGIAARNHMDRCPTVIHYARFETPFLKALRENHGPPRALPLHIICTHAIALRLLPTLPRRGIRALAGFFGHSLPQQRRSADHARATLVIWQKLVTLLASQCQVRTLDQLAQWLSTPATARAAKRVYPMQADQSRHLPDAPGVYRMRRINGDLLYVGKAKSLKKRVSSYFRPKAGHAEHLLEMLSQARRIDVTPTASALEAAVLEVEEIKRWSPPYNQALRDQGRHPVFFDQTLTRYASAADGNYCLGPLPAHNTGDALAAFGTWMGQGFPPGEHGRRSTSGIFSSPSPTAIDDDCLSAGLALFADHCPEALTVQPASRALQRLGIQYWREYLQAKETADMDDMGDKEEAFPPADEPDDSEHRWTPEDVAHRLKSQIRIWAQLLRRARWFCLLSESCLAWSCGDPSQDRHLVIVKRGNIKNISTLAADAGLPVPRGHRRSPRNRQANLDMMAYDRLRVLTTEIRRLLAQGRSVTMRFPAGGVLTEKSLTRLIQWI